MYEPYYFYHGLEEYIYHLQVQGTECCYSIILLLIKQNLIDSIPLKQFPKKLRVVNNHTTLFSLNSDSQTNLKAIQYIER